MVTGMPNEPLRAYNFRLEVAGLSQTPFRAATGLGVSIDVIRFREAGARSIVRHLPGQVTYEPVTLHYGVIAGQEMVAWLMQSVNGVVERRSASIIMLDNRSDEVLRWNLFGTWVAAWRGAMLDTLSQEVAVETVTLVYDSLEIA